MRHVFPLILFTIFFLSCKKDETITETTEKWDYINKSGHVMTIEQYFKGIKLTHALNDNDTLNQVYDKSTSDTTTLILYADSVKLVFDSAKLLVIRKTSTDQTNLMDRKNYVSFISASGQIHYYRYTFSSKEYDLAK